MILSYSKSLIKKIGVQGRSECGIYAAAYGWSILENKVRPGSIPGAYNGGHTPLCYWSIMGLTPHLASSVRSRYKSIIKELNKGRPVIIASQGSSSNHFVTVIGYRDGKNGDNIEPKDFYIVDPADNKIGWFGSTWAHGFNGSSYGLYWYEFNTSKAAGKNGAVSGGEPDHPQSWYIGKYGNEARVYFALIENGLSHKAACAVMGNIKQESNFNPEIVNSIGATGLCQWYQGRATSMKNFNSGEKSWRTIKHQIKYLMHELTTGYKGVYKVLTNSSKTLREMVYSFLHDFEKPGNYDAEMNIRLPNAEKFDKRYGGAGGGEGEYIEEEGSAGINMQQRASQLYSSNNYKWVKEQEKQQDPIKSAISTKQAAIKDFLSNMTIELKNEYGGAAPDMIVMPTSKREKIIKVANTALSVSQAVVEAPFVEVDFGGTVVGTYKNSLDDFPNHISKLEVDKINGQINKYCFELVHQIRPGEDPNLLDKVFAKVRYGKIRIRYGDFNSNTIYGDAKAVITNIVMNRDYTGNKITYTIFATSAGEFVTSYKLNFPARTAKPSTVINELLYKNPDTSKLLLEAFPGMVNTSEVSSKNLIPQNDAEVDLDEKYNISIIEYINYLVSCMSNQANKPDDTIRNSTYYISYENDFMNKLGGAFFKITELVKNSITNYDVKTNNIFEVTVGFPDDNYVLGFTVNNDMAWSLLYENANIADEFVYSINDSGDQVKEYSPNLLSSTLPANEIQKNWWTQMVNFPLNASLTLKGLMKPIMLMNYIIVNVVFYGQRHITSGVYTITGQKDSLSGSGFRTTLSLTRVGN